jgi:hypothetical protein
MWSFFHGWKRKIGVVALALACLFAGGWVRSLRRNDTLSFRDSDQSHICLQSNNSLIGFQRLREKFPFQVILNDYSTGPSFDHDRTSVKFTWKSEFAGFGAANGVEATTGIVIELWTVPYWSIVVPLTLFAAWCLLTKPCMKPPTKPEPTHA